jgi:hypothetical protein
MLVVPKDRCESGVLRNTNTKLAQGGFVLASGKGAACVVGSHRLHIQHANILQCVGGLRHPQPVDAT